MGKRLRTQRRGKGSVYKAPSHRYKAEVKYPKFSKGQGKVETLEHDPARSAPLAMVRFENGEKVYMIACESLAIGQTVQIGAEIPVEVGNVLPVGNIPEGTSIFNVEMQPGDGGKLVRACGGSATVVSHGATTRISLPSGVFKSINNHCKATIGKVAGSGRKDIPIAKAGKKANMLRSKSRVYPRTSGVAMNPVDHPHGGGGHQHVGKPSTVSKHAWPGRKVGNIAPKKKKKRK